MTLPLPFPFMLGFLSCDTPMMLRLKCEPLGAPLPVWAAATAVALSAATAAAKWNVKRMSPPSNRYVGAQTLRNTTPRRPLRGRDGGVLEPGCPTAPSHYGPADTPRGVTG